VRIIDASCFARKWHINALRVNFSGQKNIDDGIFPFCKEKIHGVNKEILPYFLYILPIYQLQNPCFSIFLIDPPQDSSKKSLKHGYYVQHIFSTGSKICQYFDHCFKNFLNING